MNLPRIFANAFARKIAAVVVVLVLSWLGIGAARATIALPDQGAAYAQCMALAAAYNASSTSTSTRSGGACTLSSTFYSCRGKSVRVSDGYVENNVSCGLVFSPVRDSSFSYPAGKTCTARGGRSGGLLQGNLYAGSVCDAGCVMQASASAPDEDFTFSDNINPPINFKRGSFSPTGSVCTPGPVTPDIPPTPPQQGCHVTSSGHQVCRGNGKTCITLASGHKNCAADSSVTGKVATNNPRTEASAISAPDTPANPPVNRPGENWQPSSNTTVTDNSNQKITNNSTFVNNGTPNGNQPVPGDGAGNGEEGEDDGPDHGTVSGGQDCTAPPVVSGGNPVENSLLFTAWATRCEGKASDADIAAAEEAADAAMHCAINAGEFCDDPNYLTPEGEVSWLDGDDPLAGSRVVRNLLDVELDDTGFLGGGSCPSASSFSVGTATVALSFEPLCNVLISVSGFVIAIAYLIAFRIIAGGFT